MGNGTPERFQTTIEPPPFNAALFYSKAFFALLRLLVFARKLPAPRRPPLFVLRLVGWLGAY